MELFFKKPRHIHLKHLCKHLEFIIRYEASAHLDAADAVPFNFHLTELQFGGQLTYEKHNSSGLTFTFTFNDDGTLYSANITQE